MIVKMSFVTLAGPKSDIDRIIDTYLSKYEIQLENALVELNSSGDLLPFVEANPYKTLLDNAHELIDLVGSDTKEPLAALTVPEATDIINDVSGKLAKYKEDIEAFKLQKKHLMEDYEKISPFKDIEYNLNDVLKMNYIKYKFGRIPKDMYRSFEEFIAPDMEALFIQGYMDNDYVYGVYFAPESSIKQIDSSFDALHFETIEIPEEYEGTPSDICLNIRKKIAVIDEDINNIESKLVNITQYNKLDILSAYKRIEIAYGNFDVRKLAACTRQSNIVFHVLCGWMATEDANRLLAETEDDDNVVCMIDEEATKKKAPPTKLKNPKVFKPFEMFVDMYGTPKYGEVDPTLLVALTYPLLFGIMFGDVGQGLCLMIGGFLLYKLKGIKLAGIISYAGLISTIFGFLYGSIFGFEDLIEGLWINPRESMVNLPVVGNVNIVFVATILFGIFLIILSMILNMYNCIKMKKYTDLLIGPNGLTGFIFYGVVIGCIVLAMTGHKVKYMAPVIVILVITLLIIAIKEPIENALEKKSKLMEESAPIFVVKQFFELFEVLLSYFTNTLSFIRVGAFAISHGIMMEVVLILAGVADGKIGLKTVIVLILGNLFVCGLEGLIVGIQCLRLEYYEMFGRFYSGTGKKFNPYQH
jgi:V/A-type H+-transporting ATPase subunit I